MALCPPPRPRPLDPFKRHTPRCTITLNMDLRVCKSPTRALKPPPPAQRCSAEPAGGLPPMPASGPGSGGWGAPGRCSQRGSAGPTARPGLGPSLSADQAVSGCHLEACHGLTPQRCGRTCRFHAVAHDVALACRSLDGSVQLPQLWHRLDSCVVGTAMHDGAERIPEQPASMQQRAASPFLQGRVPRPAAVPACVLL